MDAGQDPSHRRSAGLFLAISAALFVVGITWHAFVHPAVGATPEYSIHLIQGARTWAAMHLFLAMVSSLFAAAALTVLVVRSSLTASLLGLAGWSLLAVVVTLITNLAVFEATVQGDAAVAGDMTLFAMSFALSRGYELVLGLLPLAFLGMTLADLRAGEPVTPRWASGLALAGAALMLVAVVGASGFRIVALGPLWGAAALPMLWFIWAGVRLAFAGSRAPVHLRSVPEPHELAPG